MYAIRARRKTVTEKDFLDAVNKVIKGKLRCPLLVQWAVYDGGRNLHTCMPAACRAGQCWAAGLRVPAAAAG